MNELPPDPHLQAALRHAPDARAEAPPEIAARVLAEARRAVASPPVPPWWARWWQRAGTGWMQQGAFATLLLAGLVALLWRDDRPGPTVEQTPIAESPAPDLRQAPAPVVAEVAAVASAAPAAPAARVAPARERTAARAPATDAARADALQQAGRQAKAAQDLAAETAERRQEAPPRTPPPAPPAPLSPPPAPAAATAPAPAGAATAAAAPPLRPAPPAAALNRMALAAPEPAPWGDPPGGPDRLLRPGLERSVGRVDPVWLAALARSTAAPWQDAGTAPPASEPALVWEREGMPYGRLWIERREARNWVLWCAAAAETRCQQAPLRGEVPALPR